MNEINARMEQMERAIAQHDAQTVVALEIEDWVSLRRRLADGGEIYEEDKLLIDHLLECLEL